MLDPSHELISEGYKCESGLMQILEKLTRLNPLIRWYPRHTETIYWWLISCSTGGLKRREELVLPSWKVKNGDWRRVSCVCWKAWNNSGLYPELIHPPEEPSEVVLGVIYWNQLLPFIQWLATYSNMDPNLLSLVWRHICILFNKLLNSKAIQLFVFFFNKLLCG
jgi:hypothetical protein